MQTIGGDIEAIDEDSDDWRVLATKGSVDIGVRECAVAGAQHLDVVDLEVPQLHLGVFACPEIDSYSCPHGCSEVESERY